MLAINKLSYARPLFFILFGIHMSGCKNGLFESAPLPILHEESIQIVQMPKLPAGIVEDSLGVAALQEEGVPYPKLVATTDFSTNMWVYSTLPVERLVIDRGMLFLVPKTKTYDGLIYFLRVSRREIRGLKMTSPERNGISE